MKKEIENTLVVALFKIAFAVFVSAPLSTWIGLKLLAVYGVGQ